MTDEYDAGPGADEDDAGPGADEDDAGPGADEDDAGPGANEDVVGPGADDATPAAGPRDTPDDDPPSAGYPDTDSQRSDPPAPDPDDATRSLDDDREGNVAGLLARDQPLEPGAIDLENAVFVLIGVGIVVGFLLLGIAGL